MAFGLYELGAAVVYLVDTYATVWSMSFGREVPAFLTSWAATSVGCSFIHKCRLNPTEKANSRYSQ